MRIEVIRRWFGVGSAVLLSGCSLVGYPDPSPGSSVSPDGGALGAPMAEPKSRSGNPASYEINGSVYYVLASADRYVEEGYASWYGDAFAGRPTSSGEIFDPDLLTAAHRTLPLPTWVEVTNLENGRQVILRVNDRGPFADPARRIIDVSEAAARRLALIGPGVARVRVRALRPEELRGAGSSPPGAGREPR